jgi:hypothetical protein
MTVALRTTWVQRWEAESILARTASLLGWDPLLAGTGYTYDDEGLGIKYTDYLEDPTLISACTEMHFTLRR